MADVSEGAISFSQRSLSLTPTLTISAVKYTCPTHGKIESRAIQIVGIDGTWCIHCIHDALVKMGIQKVERDNG